MMVAEPATREVPILFRPEMVRAILAGVKVETRRIVKPQPKYVPHDGRLAFGDRYAHPEYDGKRGIRRPYEEGDVLWVRETWRLRSWWPGEPPTIEFRAGGWTEPDPRDYDEDRRCADWEGRVVEKAEAEIVEKGIRPNADGEFRFEDGNPLRWNPSIFLPKYVARLWLRVLSVRVEKLGAITDEGALREGAETDEEGRPLPGSFRALWDRVHGENAFEKHRDLYVWVVGFAPLRGRP